MCVWVYLFSLGWTLNCDTNKSHRKQQKRRNNWNDENSWLQNSTGRCSTVATSSSMNAIWFWLTHGRYVWHQHISFSFIVKALSVPIILLLLFWLIILFFSVDANWSILTSALFWLAELSWAGYTIYITSLGVCSVCLCHFVYMFIDYYWNNN